MITKICSDLDCESEIEDQPLENFHVATNRADGRIAKCKVCTARHHKIAYRAEKLGASVAIKAVPLPTASSELIKVSIANEEKKMSEENLESIIKSMKGSRASKCYAEFYVEDCLATIKKLKGLLQAPL